MEAQTLMGLDICQDCWAMKKKRIKWNEDAVKTKLAPLNPDRPVGNPKKGKQKIFGRGDSLTQVKFRNVENE